MVSPPVWSERPCIGADHNEAPNPKASQIFEQFIRVVLLATVGLWFGCGAANLHGAPPDAVLPDAVPAKAVQPSAGQLKMLELLESRVAKTPKHSDSWRLLGRLQQTLGDTDAALQSLRRAVDEDAFSAAAHFDLGQLKSQQGRNEEARQHFDQVFQIAPASSYAEQLRQAGVQPRAAASQQTASQQTTSSSVPPDCDTDADVSIQPVGSIKPVGYQIQSFDGSDDVEQRFIELESEVRAPLDRLRVFLESGLLFNSNVTLTPVSRELAQSDNASFQGFTNPDLDWKLIRTENFRLGPSFRGYFTINESDFSAFNLASFQPGAFAERDFLIGQSEAIGRLNYVFSSDFFDGDSVGNRHAATASLTLIRPDLEAFYLYATLAESDFAQDGLLPSQTSLDGTTYTTGISRFFQTGWQAIPMHAVGVDFELADTEGDDFRYHSINLHGSGTWNISQRWQLTPTWGVGYRDYFDFTGAVPREELFWRIHGRLNYRINDRWSVAAVCGHDRFASDNQDFDTERTEGGIVCTFTR